MEPILEVRDLYKDYPKVRAVNGVSLSIREGICFGLLGPNGAGKTTTIEMIEGIQRPTSGAILFRGKTIGPEFRQKSGIQFQETALQDYLTVREVLRMFSQFYDHPVAVDDLSRMCALGDYMDRDVHKLSGGQRQRLLLAVALVNDPDILFLDEPTTGLDPQARRNFWDLVEGIQAKGKTIVLTTHYMEEAHALCDEIAIMDRGQLIAQGKPDDLLQEHFEGVAIEIPKVDFKLDPRTIPWPIFEKIDRFEIQTKDVAGALEFLMKAKVNLSHLSVRSRNLEDLFLELTGKGLRA